MNKQQAGMPEKDMRLLKKQYIRQAVITALVQLRERFGQELLVRLEESEDPDCCGRCDPPKLYLLLVFQSYAEALEVQIDEFVSTDWIQQDSEVRKLVRIGRDCLREDLSAFKVGEQIQILQAMGDADQPDYESIVNKVHAYWWRKIQNSSNEIIGVDSEMRQAIRWYGYSCEVQWRLRHDSGLVEETFEEFQQSKAFKRWQAEAEATAEAAMRVLERSSGSVE